MREFARVMPITMFLKIVNLPLDRREEFVEWGLVSTAVGFQASVAE